MAKRKNKPTKKEEPAKPVRAWRRLYSFDCSTPGCGRHARTVKWNFKLLQLCRICRKGANLDPRQGKLV